MASKSKVYFFKENVDVRISQRAMLKKTVERLFKAEGKRLNSMSYIFSTDENLRNINRQYLKRDYYTDIITFDLSENEEAISGESYISVDRLKENALKLGMPFREELWRLVLHGALHLCGYNDKTEMQRLQMRKRESHYISILLRGST